MGKEAALRLARDGAEVIAADVLKDQVYATAAEIEALGRRAPSG